MCLYFLPAVREPQFDRWLGEVTWKREWVLLTTTPYVDSFFVSENTEARDC